MQLKVLYQFNDKYAPFAGVSITSLCENNQNIEEILFYILGEDISEQNVKRLSLCVQKYSRKIIYVDTKGIIEQMKDWRMPQYRGSYAANIRLFLPELLPKEKGRILYLDADTIITGELSHLWSIDMCQKPLAMVRDSLGTKHKYLIGLQAEDDYYNSGVILFDMMAWRKHKYSEQIIEHIREVRTSYPSPDQDLLNVICCKNILTLEPSYNLQPVHKVFSFVIYEKVYGLEKYYDKAAVDNALQNTVIHHMFRFIGGFPWNSNHVHPDTKLFDKYLQISEWQDYERQSVDAGMAIKIEKILYQILPKAWFLRIFKIAHERFIVQANTESLKNKVDKRM